MFGSKLICKPTEELTVEERLSLSLTELVKVRTSNTLEAEGILYVRDVLTRTEKELLAIHNFGQGALKEVLAALDTIGFSCTNFTLPTTAVG